MRNAFSILFFLLLSSVGSGQIPTGLDQELSYKSFIQRTFANDPTSRWNGKVVYRSNFAQEEPDTVVFPVGVSGLVLVCCNLENVVIPAGAVVDDMGGVCGIRRRVKVQNDGRDWEIDNQNRPVKVVSEKAEILKGRSVDPRDIPSAGALARVRAACLAEARIGGRTETQYEAQRCARMYFEPDEMLPARIAERKARGEN